MPVPQGCSRDTTSLSPACSGQRRLFAHCLNALETFLGGGCWQIKEVSARGKRVCSLCLELCESGWRGQVPSQARGSKGGIQGKAKSKDALQDSALGISCAHFPMHRAGSTHQNYPKARIYTLNPHRFGSIPFLMLLFQSSVRVLWRAPRERRGLSRRDTGWPWGHRLSPSARRTVGLPRVSLLIFCAASPSARRPQWLWQPHLFTG